MRQTKRGNYVFVTAENKAKIAKYAYENSVTALIRYFKRTEEFTTVLKKVLYMDGSVPTEAN